MNVVDSSGWIEYFVAGPNARFFAPPIENAGELLVPSISVFEVYRHVLRERGADDALRAAAALQQGRQVELDADLALTAAELALEHRLPLADSIIYATAQVHGAVVWTQDSDFDGLDGVRYRAKKR